MNSLPLDDDAMASRQTGTPEVGGQFLRRIAHDIASPAGVTLTVMEELAAAEGVRPELLGMAKRSLRRLLRLSEHLALLAELEAGELRPERTAVDIRLLAKRALDDALAVDGRKEVVTNCDLPAVALMVDVDSRLMVIVLREVIGNALRLATSQVELRVSADAGHALVRVDDDGPGFSPDALAALGRFVRRTSTRGLGLSLSMANAILRGHNGDLRVEQSSLPSGRRGTPGAAVIIRVPGRPSRAP